jgi:hypothetical protein
MRSFLFVSAVLVLAAAMPGSATAQRNRDRDRNREDPQDVESRIDTTFAFSRTGVVDLTQISGDVIVTAWDRGEARVRAFSERGRIRSTLSKCRSRSVSVCSPVAHRAMCP